LQSFEVLEGRLTIKRKKDGRGTKKGVNQSRKKNYSRAAGRAKDAFTLLERGLQ